MDRHGGDSEVPAFVQTMIDSDFPADGEVHVERRGKFAIRPSTLFCSYPSLVDGSLREKRINGVGLVGLSQLLEAHGQDANYQGTRRQGRVDRRHCPAESGHVMEYGLARLNRHGEPYRVVLALWQGDSAWVGRVERVRGGVRPEIHNPYGTDPLPFEIRADVTRLSDRALRGASAFAYPDSFLED